MPAVLKKSKNEITNQKALCNCEEQGAEQLQMQNVKQGKVLPVTVGLSPVLHSVQTNTKKKILKYNLSHYNR